MQTLTVTLVQGATRWHDASANRNYYGELVRRSVQQDSDLVILPENFLSGFSNDMAVCPETMDGENVQWMRALAVEVGAVICGSLAISDSGKVFNRLVWMRPDGIHACYDKRHLFRMAGEYTRYSSGHQRLIVELRGWRILPQICYDLRFPVWLRNSHCQHSQGGMDYDLALFVANWPMPRCQQWRTLLRARAIENLCCVAAVNRVGCDGNNLTYAGDSVALDSLGESLLEMGTQEQTATVHFDPSRLLAHREQFPAWMDADSFRLIIP